MPSSNDFKANSLNNIDDSHNQKNRNLSDQDLLIKIAKGDKLSFGILYERYLDQIYNYIFFQVNGNHHETEDLTEEVFLRAFTTVLEKPKLQANFKALVYRIAHNLVIDTYRTKKVEIDLEKVDLVSEKLRNPEEALENVQLSKELASAIKELKPNLQEVIIFRYILDLNTDEIAEIMGISRNYVRVLQYRALQSLKVKI
jgi:RNA polymerase sigma-70 factor (ECF subfamily)